MDQVTNGHSHPPIIAQPWGLETDLPTLGAILSIGAIFAGYGSLPPPLDRAEAKSPEFPAGPLYFSTWNRTRFQIMPCDSPEYKDKYLIHPNWIDLAKEKGGFLLNDKINDRVCSVYQTVNDPSDISVAATAAGKMSFSF